jgi:hypothetical protein
VWWWWASKTAQEMALLVHDTRIQLIRIDSRRAQSKSGNGKSRALRDIGRHATVTTHFIK